MSLQSTTTPMPHEPSSTPATQADQADPANWAELAPRQQRVILVCDVVESVRWMEQYEDEAIVRWSQFASEVRERVAPAHGGQVIKSTGDGLLMEFQTAPSAVAAATALQKIATQGNERLAPDRQMLLRIGIHQAEARRDAHDLYGHGVNLAARITTLANPGEIIVTPEVRDHLTDSLDGDIEDMGECYLKHLQEPQRVYRVNELHQPRPIETLTEHFEELKPSIAVIPFENHCKSTNSWAIGELLADGVIAQLSRNSEFKILSRLSTRALRGRNENLLELAKALRCTHVVSGYYLQTSTSMKLVYELSRIKDTAVIDAGQLNFTEGDVFSDNSEAIQSISIAIKTKLIEAEANAVRFKPLPSLHGYSLLLGGIQGMHNSTLDKFQKSREVFEHLIARHPRNGEPRAWFAKWHVLSAVRNLGLDKNKLATSALMHTQKALDSTPDNSLAMCMQGFAYLHLCNDFEKAQLYLDKALSVNPNEAFAWLITSVLSSIRDKPSLALAQSQTAMELSPIDPLRYYFLSLRASALLSANLIDPAIETAQESIRLNLHHSPTLRILVTAQVEAGNIDDAKLSLAKLLRLQPDLTVSSYLAAGSQTKTRLQCARALQEAGLN